MRDALAWLLSFSDPTRGVGWSPGTRGGLEANVRRTRILLDLAGAPDRRMSVVLVAGTKGKGSTAAMIASILEASGVRGGLSTKPHLQSFRERVRVDGRAISQRALDARIDELRPLVRRLAHVAPEVGRPTTFELITVLALMQYERSRCRTAVIEVGLGGRYDATNATDPVVSVITAISHDHTRELGSDISRIAREKAGIMRPGRVAVVAPQTRAARDAIFDVARRTGSVPRIVTAVPSTLRLALAGAHQRANAAAAVAACEELAPHGVPFDRGAVARALARVRFPGRFEVVPGRPTIVLDGAHNDGSAEALAATLRSELPRRRVRLVLGIMADKDARAVVRPLLPLAASAEVVRAPGPRGLDARVLARLVRGVPVRAHDDIAAAIDAARAISGPRDVVVVTGSLALVGAARDTLGLPVAERLW